MRAVDTNVLVRLIAQDDPRQLAAATAFVDDGAWVSHLVLLETAWVLDTSYGVPRDALAFAIEALLDHERITVEGADVVASALATFRRRATVSFADCLILETARRAGHLPLGTFDRSLARVEGATRL